MGYHRFKALAGMPSSNNSILPMMSPGYPCRKNCATICFALDDCLNKEPNVYIIIFYGLKIMKFINV